MKDLKIELNICSLLNEPCNFADKDGNCTEPKVALELGCHSKKLLFGDEEELLEEATKRQRKGIRNTGKYKSRGKEKRKHDF